MATEIQYYSVKELSEKLGVPRTTVNDWLSRYGSFIDYTLRGKRKVYTGNVLDVLGTISELREKELSSYDVEKELAKKYPVHPEFAAGETAAEAFQGKQSGEEEELSTALVPGKQAGEIAEMLNSALTEIRFKMEYFEEQQRKHASRSAAWYIIAVSALGILILAGLFAVLKLDYLRSVNERLAAEKVHAETVLENKTSLLDASRTRSLVLKNQVDYLSAGLQRQKKEFARSIESMKKSAELREKAGILKLRDDFAAERLEWLKRLDDARNDREKMMRIIGALQEQMYSENIRPGEDPVGLESGSGNKTPEIEEDKQPGPE